MTMRECYEAIGGNYLETVNKLNVYLREETEKL